MTRRRQAPGSVPRTRRRFLGEIGRGSVALAVLSPAFVAACSSGADTASNADTATNTNTNTDTDTATNTAASDPASDSASSDSELRWAQVELGFVSAYVVARGNRAAIYDTGVPGSAAAIGQSLSDLGLTYSNVDHVVLSHHHNDHAGSIQEVMDQAINATVYAGEADLASISFADVTPLVGGEDVFGFEALHTPGHTDGHMAVIDHDAGLLIAGDAVFTEGGAAIEGPERFFNDVEESRDSIRSLASLSYNTLLVGHGPPLEGAADAAVVALANSL